MPSATLKKMPSRPVAYGTRAPLSTDELSEPMPERTMATVIQGAAPRHAEAVHDGHDEQPQHGHRLCPGEYKIVWLHSTQARKVQSENRSGHGRNQKAQKSRDARGNRRH